MRYITSIAAAAIFMASAVTASHAQLMNNNTMCSERDDLVVIITEEFGVSPNGMGVVNDDLIIEHFVADNGVWVILFTKGNGRSCVRAIGKHWAPVPRPDAIAPSVW